MANSRTVLRGNSLSISAIFTGATGERVDPSPVSSLKLSVYPVGLDPRLGAETSDAWVYDVTTTSGGSGPLADADVMLVHEGTGHYSYDIVIPEDADLGIGYDKWEATVDLSDIDETFMFIVASPATIILDETPLCDNNIVTITLDSTIQAEDGTTLGTDYEWYFTTTYTPLYTSLRRLRLDLGTLIANIPDDTINLAIFEASLMADSLTFGQLSLSASQMSFFEFARRQYVTCAAEATLLDVIMNANVTGKTKQLAQLQVSYSGSSSKDPLLWKRIQDCLVKWEASLTSSGEIAPGTSLRPDVAIKGYYDVDRPAFGRDWSSTSSSRLDQQIPASNTRTRGLYNKRWKRGFSSTRWNSRFRTDS